MGIYIIGVFYFLCWLVWILTGETILTLDPVELNIQRRVLGIELDTRSFRCEEVDRLIFVHPGKSAGSRTYFDLRSGRIQFRANHSKHRFATGILESEANALIELMQKILQFPRNSRHGTQPGQIRRTS
jgi:hypothetical protein